MRRPSVLLWAPFVFAFLLAQSPHNSVSHGIFLDQADASSLGYGGVGLLPSHDSKFSLRNPSSWADIRFAFLTAHYNTGRVEYGKGQFRSDFGRLSHAAFIVPMKNKYAWGMGISPFSRKQFSFSDDSVATIFFAADTSVLSKRLEGSGGISSLFTGGAWKINDVNSVGVQFDFLFGTFDEATTTSLFGQPAIYRRHFEYRGTLISFFLRSSHFEWSRKSTFYLGIQGPVGKSRVIRTDYYTYTGPERKPAEEFPLPITLSGGAVYHVSSNIHLGVEIVNRQFDRNKASLLSSLPGSTGNGYRISGGVLRERVAGSHSFLDLFHYRVGFFQRQHYILRAENALKERGFAFGLGIPFGLAQNQIDIGFRYSERKGLFSSESEIIRQLTVGLTIGDIWLVKRRRR